jgi:DNA-binding XRE family transcriptional regulator
MSYSRMKELEQFATSARSLKLEDHGEFKNFIVRSMGILEIGDREFADSLSVSRPTVNRWSNGKNLPHIALRKAIIVSVVVRVERKMRAIGKAASLNASDHAYASYPVAAKSR